MSYSSLNPRTHTNDYLRIRPESFLPKTINDEIKMISFNRKSPDAKIYGSFSYIIQKYAADIDLYEYFYPPGSKENTIKKFEKSLIEVVKSIIKKKGHWFSEYKTGIDKRYEVDIGKMKNGEYTVNPELKKIIDLMFSRKLLNRKEVSLLRRCIKESKTNKNNSDAYDIIYNIFRERRVLRWTQKEILNKKKSLPAGKHITLKEALEMKGHIKIDEIVYLDGKFFEVTNFVFVGYKNDFGFDVPMNIPKISYDIVVNGLKDEIEKLYLSNFYYSPFKVVKRMFALSRYIYLTKKKGRYGTNLRKIIPFVSSDTSFLYQMKAELEAILRILTVSVSYPKISINEQIENLKVGLSNIVELDDNDINEFNEQVDQIVKAKLKRDKKKLIKKLIDDLKFVINYLTINYFNKIDFNPPGREYYPRSMKYKIIKRKPLDEPQKNSELIKLYKML